MANYFLAPIGNDAPFFLPTGVAASGAKLFTYVAGSTTKQNTYTDNTGGTPNANPIILNSSGYPASGGNVVEIWGNTGVTYKFVLAPSTDSDPPASPYWTRDNVALLNDTSGTVSEWISGPAPTYISATSFSLVGDQTAAFTVGRRLKTTNTGGTIYSTITASAFTSLTTITVVNDSSSLDSGLSAVSYGILQANNSSIPFTKESSTGLVSAYGYVNKNALTGLTLSTAGGSGTMTISAGEASDSTNVANMVLAASIGKTTSAWAVGTGNGGLDTGAIATATWYKFYEIMRKDTGVVDVIFTTAALATGPALPTNYTLFRYIGSGLTDGSSHWVKFIQDGDLFQWDVPVKDITATNPGTSAVSATLSVPLGVNVRAWFAALLNAGTSNNPFIVFSDLAVTDTAASNANFSMIGPTAAAAGTDASGEFYTRTNTSSAIRYRLSASGGSDIVIITTRGWIDTRQK